MEELVVAPRAHDHGASAGGRASRWPERQQARRARLEEQVGLEAREGAAPLVRQRDPLWQLTPPLPRQQMSGWVLPGTAARGQRHHRQSDRALPRKRWHLLSPTVGRDGCLRDVPGTRHTFHHIRLREALGGRLCCLDRRSAADSAVVPPSSCNFAQCCLDCRERLQWPLCRPIISTSGSVGRFALSLHHWQFARSWRRVRQIY